MGSNEKAVEVWRNTTPGLRWYIGFDVRGSEAERLVQGNKTFTLTTMERQLNQDRAASPEQDLFRNGTFVMAKASEETILEEVESPDALTDLEIEAMVRDLVFGDTLKIEDAIRDITSNNTLYRIMESLVLEDAPGSMTEFVKNRMREIDPAMPVDKSVVTTASPAAPKGRTRKPAASKA